MISMTAFGVCRVSGSTEEGTRAGTVETNVIVETTIVNRTFHVNESGRSLRIRLGVPPKTGIMLLPIPWRPTTQSPRDQRISLQNRAKLVTRVRRLFSFPIMPHRLSQARKATGVSGQIISRWDVNTSMQSRKHQRDLCATMTNKIVR